MKIKKKKTRKQFLKQEDEFITTSVKMLKWTKENYNKIIIAGVIVFVVVVTVLTIRLTKKNNYIKSQNFLATAKRIYTADVRSPSDDPNTPLGPDKFANVNDKYQNALVAFEHIIDLYPKSEAAEEAKFYIGSCKHFLGRYEEAIDSYNNYLMQYPNGVYILQAKIGIAYAQQGMGNYESAINSFNEIIDYYQDYKLLDAIYMQLGLCYEEKGDMENAKKSYQQVVLNYPNSPFLEDAQKKINLIEGKV